MKICRLDSDRIPRGTNKRGLQVRWINFGGSRFPLCGVELVFPSCIDFETADAMVRFICEAINARHAGSEGAKR